MPNRPPNASLLTRHRAGRRGFLLTAPANRDTRAEMDSTHGCHKPPILRSSTAARLGGWMLGILAVLAGCSGGKSDGPRRDAPLSERSLRRSDVLSQLLLTPHVDVAQRLGAHRIESETRWTVTPLSSSKTGPDVAPGFRVDSPVQPFEGPAAWESQVATLVENRAVELDKSGALRLSNQNDHGQGFDAVWDKQSLYLRVNGGPYVKRPAEPDEVDQLRALSYETGTGLWGLLGPYLYLSQPSETTRLSRAAWTVKLSPKEASEQKPSSDGPGQSWRKDVVIDSLDGQVTIDRQTGVPVDLALSLRFQTKRGSVPRGTADSGGERVQIEVQHTLKLSALGEQVAAVTPPSEWIAAPSRPRPMQEKQELLMGLLPQRP